jgi:Zn-dependent protease
MAIVAVAGPISNLVFAGVLVGIWRLGQGILPAEAQSVIFYMISINLLLFAFNLIPIPPLDGFNILVGILPNYWTIVLEPLRRYSLPILLGLVFIVPYAGQILHLPLNPVSAALIPVITALDKIFLGWTGLM